MFEIVDTYASTAAALTVRQHGVHPRLMLMWGLLTKTKPYVPPKLINTTHITLDEGTHLALIA